MSEQIDSPVTVTKYRRKWKDKTYLAFAGFFALLVVGSVVSLISAIAATSPGLVMSSLALVAANTAFLALAVYHARKNSEWVLVDVSKGDPDWTESKVV